MQSIRTLEACLLDNASPLEWGIPQDLNGLHPTAVSKDPKKPGSLSRLLVGVTEDSLLLFSHFFF